MAHSALDDTVEAQFIGRLQSYMEKNLLYPGWQGFTWHLDPLEDGREPNETRAVEVRFANTDYEEQGIGHQKPKAEVTLRLSVKMTGRGDVAKELYLLKDQLKSALQANPHLMETNEEGHAAVAATQLVRRAWLSSVPDGPGLVGSNRCAMDLVISVDWDERHAALLPPFAWEISYG